jgi:threonine dehydrogenase-like Zn-dependent dehydrogenase
MGAAEVAVEARHPHQHQARECIGAVVPTSGYDVVIETGGSESALQRAVELARVGGTVGKVQKVHQGLTSATLLRSEDTRAQPPKRQEVFTIT